MLTLPQSPYVKSAESALAELFAAAKAAQANAYAPYSRFLRSARRCARRRARSFPAATSRTPPIRKGPAPKPARSPRWRSPGNGASRKSSSSATATPLHALRRLPPAHPRIRRSLDPDPYRRPRRRAGEVHARRTSAGVVRAGSSGGLTARQTGAVDRVRPLKVSIASRRVLVSADMKPNKIAVIGLGAIGYGVAASLARKGWPVVGADANPAATERFAHEFGKPRPVLRARLPRAPTLLFSSL